MLEIVVTLCLVGAPDTCERRPVPFDGAGPIACLMAGETTAMRLLETRPGWRVARIACGPRRIEL